MKLICKSLFLLCLGLNALTAHADRVVLETSMGNITLDISGAGTPQLQARFIAAVRQGFYDNTVIYRVVKNFVVQGGRMKSTKNQGSEEIRWENGLGQEVVDAEIRKSLPNTRGSFALATANDGINGYELGEFFINLKDNPFLNYTHYEQATLVPTRQGLQSAPAGTERIGYPVIGRVVAGMDVVEKIAKVQVRLDKEEFAELAFSLEVPVEPVLVKRISVLP